MFFLRSFIGDVLFNVVINKQKYCFERKNWIAMKAKKIVLSLLYHFWEKNTGIENIYKTRKKSTKKSCGFLLLGNFSREVSIQKQLPELFCQKKCPQKFRKFHR